MGRVEDPSGFAGSAYRSSDTSAVIARGEGADKDSWALIAAAYDACVLVWTALPSSPSAPEVHPPRPSKALIRRSLTVLLQLHEADRVAEARELARSAAAWFAQSGGVELRGALLAKWRVAGELARIEETVPAPIRAAAARGWWRGTHGEARKVVRAFIAAQPPARMAAVIHALRRHAPTVAAVLEGVASAADVCAAPPQVRGFLPLVAAVLSLLSLGLYLRGVSPQPHGGTLVVEVPSDLSLVRAVRVGRGQPPALYDDATSRALEARTAAAEIEELAVEHDDVAAELAAHALRAAVVAVDCSEAREDFTDLALRDLGADAALPMARLRASLRAMCPSR